MRGKPRQITVALTGDERERLLVLCQSPGAEDRLVVRARVLLMADAGKTNSEIAKTLGITRPTVGKILKKGAFFGMDEALKDLSRSGRPRRIGPEARSWVISLASRFPGECPDGPDAQAWTIRSLTRYVHDHCEEEGHSVLATTSESSIWYILRDGAPGTGYRLERKELGMPEFAGEVFLLSIPVVWGLRQADERAEAEYRAEPMFGGASPAGGTVFLQAAIDLLSGSVVGHVSEEQGIAGFLAFLGKLDGRYPGECVIHVILADQGMERSQEVMDYLSARKGRFRFIFTPKRAPWLNLVESLYLRMACQALGGQPVPSRQAFIGRAEAWLKDVGNPPLPFRWQGNLADIADISGAFGR